MIIGYYELLTFNIIIYYGFVHIRDYLFSFFSFVEKEGKAVHFSYQDKLTLIAYTKQVSHGRYNQDTLPPLGVLDVIGRDRR